MEKAFRLATFRLIHLWVVCHRLCFIIVSRLLPVEFYAARTCELLLGLQQTIKCPFPLIAALATSPYSLVAGPPAGSTGLTPVLHEWRMCGHFAVLLDGCGCRV